MYLDLDPNSTPPSILYNRTQTLPYYRIRNGKNIKKTKNILGEGVLRSEDTEPDLSCDFGLFVNTSREFGEGLLLSRNLLRLRPAEPVELWRGCLIIPDLELNTIDQQY